MGQSVFRSIVDAVRETIAGLALPKIDSESIKVADYPPESIEDCLVTLPGVLIVPGRDIQSNDNQGTNERDDIGYPVVIGIFDCRKEPNCDQYQEATEGDAFDRASLWHQRIRRIFHNQRAWASDLDTVIKSSVTTATARDDNLRKMRLLNAQTLYLRVVSREPRTQ